MHVGCGISSRILLLALLAGALPLKAKKEREQKPEFAQVIVHAGQAGCAVQLDDGPEEQSAAQGDVVLNEVDPGDHYVHVRCPGQDETGHFISPQAGAKVEVHAERTGPHPAAVPSEELGIAETRVRLRHLLQQGLRLRAQGRLDEAVDSFREAVRLDPKNADLHRELGITLLLARDWKRARVEMLEAVHHDPQDTDAYSGLGYALEKMDDLDGAAKAYRTAMHLDPDDSSYRNHYLSVLVKMQEQKTRKK
jgi:tetratricopeptide (TPR) repeat protein